MNSSFKLNILFSCFFVSALFFPIISCSLEGEEEDDSSSLDTKGHGFGEAYDWVGFEGSFDLAKASKKPLMLVIHKSWCGACKALQPQFAQSQQIQELSREFIMVNTMDDDEPEGDLYKPDGGYIPRILFFNPNGNLMRHIINEEGSPDYKYYYHEDDNIAMSMRRVLKHFEPEIRDDISGKTEL